MTRRHHSFVGRRIFLKAAGASLALPGLESVAPKNLRADDAQTASEDARRLVFVSHSLGVVHDTFFPERGSGRDYQMPLVLSELESIRDDMTVVSNLDHGLKGGHHAAGGIRNGVKPVHANKSPFGALSVDQLAAETVGPVVRFPSIRCWVKHALSWSYNRNGTRLPASTPGPVELYESLFLDGSADEKARSRALIGEGKSILDIVSMDAQRLGKKLSKSDHKKLEEYYDSIRKLEVRLVDRDRWLDRAKPNSPDKEISKRYTKPGYQPSGKVETLEAWFDLAYLALATDSTRVLTLDIDISGYWSELPGILLDAHALSHHGREEAKKDQFRTIQRAILSQYRKFVERLRSHQMPDGKSLLDSTLVLYNSGLSNGSTHSNVNLPTILSGGTGRSRGMHFDGEGKQLYNRLYLSMLQWQSPTIERFNNVNKPLVGLELV